MSGLFIVENNRGPDYDHTRTRREQHGWNEHAAFMDRLVGEGTIVLGGPVGEIDGESTLLVVRAEHERAVRAAFEPDPSHRRATCRPAGWTRRALRHPRPPRS